MSSISVEQTLKLINTMGTGSAIGSDGKLPSSNYRKETHS